MRKGATGQGGKRAGAAGPNQNKTNRAGKQPPSASARPRAPETPAVSADKMRIAKAIARAGLCSRRDAERWINDGRVMVNGILITSPALDVRTTDQVTVDGKPLPQSQPVQLWRYHKPRGLVTTHRDPQGRPTVFDNLPDGLPRVVSIGRLDFNTEGLMLLTTDGDLARHIELPSTGWLRRYRVRAHGRVAQSDLDALKDGAEIDGVRYGPIEATMDSAQGGNCWLTIGLREGKNREVRKILSSLSLRVNRLIRVSFGPFQLLDLSPGSAEPVKQRALAAQLGEDVAQRFALTGPAINTTKPKSDKQRTARPRPARRPKRRTS